MEVPSICEYVPPGVVEMMSTPGAAQVNTGRPVVGPTRLRAVFGNSRNGNNRIVMRARSRIVG